jgi:isoleucyl-tRNA synthetase
MLGNLYDLEENHRYYRGYSGSCGHPIDDLFLEHFSINFNPEKYLRRGEFHLAIKTIEEFFYKDLSIYFDSVKDRLYCDSAKSMSRIIVQNTFAELIPRLFRSLEPILPFMVHEIRNECQDHFKKSKHTIDTPVWYFLWNKFSEMRESINKNIEPLREKKEIGHNNECIVNYYCNEDKYRYFFGKSYIDALRAMTSVSELFIHLTDGEERIIVEKSTKNKCERCWSRYEGEHESLCERCEKIETCNV